MIGVTRSRKFLLKPNEELLKLIFIQFCENGRYV